MYYIKSSSTDPYFNLALEQYVFDRLSREHSYFMLWQNHNAIILGRYQNAYSEVNGDYVRANDIKVARRLSGGGAVYHDMGNLNFTFIVDAQGSGSYDFAKFCQPIQRALAELGVQVDISGRNDMTIDGRKFSGNSQYVKQGRVMHHGTILYDSDLTVLSKALLVSKDKLVSKGVSSVKSRVANIRPFMKDSSLNMEGFIKILSEIMVQENQMQTLELTDRDIEEVMAIRDSRYSLHSWNYGQSPAFSIEKRRRLPDIGEVQVLLNVKRDSIIEDIRFFGDYFGDEDSSSLSSVLKGVKLEEQALLSAMEGTDISKYFAQLSTESLVELLLQ